MDLSGPDLRGVKFDGANLTRVIITKADLSRTTFENCVFDGTDLIARIFDGATMDKLTYAVLKGSKATLTNVKAI